MESLSKRISGCFVMIFVMILFPLEGKTKENLPTIEELTNGKVKIEDLVDKNNVDLVKEYLSSGVYEMIKKGMVLRMGTQIPPERFQPKAFKEATKRNRGKAVINEDGIVQLKDGSLWPGGIPFIEPKTGMEAMGNFKFGTVWDDLYHSPISLLYINKNGKRYKKVGQMHKYMYTNCRTQVPPLGTVKGYENILYKRLSVGTYPIEIKGLGQFTIRYYDDVKNYDTGFVYLPAFKRTIRVSATTWQDNVAGSDLVYGDGNAFQDPYSGWKFKLIKEKAYILASEMEAPFIYFDKEGEFDKRLKFDEGYKFPRIGWTIYPMSIIEATPKIKHLYSKKIVYLPIYPYWPACTAIPLADCYDRRNALWKPIVHFYGDHYLLDGEPYHVMYGGTYYDFQTDHSTQMWYKEYFDTNRYKPEDITLRSLLEVSR
ncbi:MAG: DUF1329 domain-containing protein [Thermodesulfobacteriota bacterium]|nr:DUF1329 domain-containing protein [Thermodesulfobacteriota bacterium]